MEVDERKKIFMYLATGVVVFVWTWLALGITVHAAVTDSQAAQSALKTVHETSVEGSASASPALSSQVSTSVAAPATAKAGPPSSVAIDIREGKLSVSIGNAGIREILKALEAKTGIRYVVHPDIPDEQRSLYLSSLPIRETEAILRNLGLDNYIVTYDRKEAHRAIYILPEGKSQSDFLSGNPRLVAIRGARVTDHVLAWPLEFNAIAAATDATTEPYEKRKGGIAIVPDFLPRVGHEDARGTIPVGQNDTLILSFFPDVTYRVAVRSVALQPGGTLTISAQLADQPLATFLMTAGSDGFLITLQDLDKALLYRVTGDSGKGMGSVVEIDTEKIPPLIR